MHARERDKLIVNMLTEKGFVSFQDLQRALTASPATLRRDLDRLQEEGMLIRVRGGARAGSKVQVEEPRLLGVPFLESVHLHSAAKSAIGKAAASLCHPGDALIIDGGSTTLQMCPHLEPLHASVMTNSLHIVSALLPQAETSVSMTGGTVFREQNIVLNPFDEEGSCPSFHAARMFFGCAAITHFGVMQSDIILVQSERKLFRMADELVVLADSSKFSASAGHLLCELKNVSTLITDEGMPDDARRMLEDAGIHLIVVPLA